MKFSTHSYRPSPIAHRFSAAFTLVEMLVVLAVIGIMAGLVLPHVGSMTKSQGMTAATRQLLDDVAYARQKALSEHTTVYMVFVPPQFWQDARLNQILVSGNPAFLHSKQQLTNLLQEQGAAYALFARRSVGDQPGTYHPRYLTGWRSLPDGILIETNKFETNAARVASPIGELLAGFYQPGVSRSFNVTNFQRADFPFPIAEATNTAAAGGPVFITLPYVAFDSQGRLATSGREGTDEFIPLAAGSVFYPRDASEALLFQPPDVLIKQYREPARTNYTLIRIDWLTGRAKLEKPEL